jgi:hypothetical protein
MGEPSPATRYLRMSLRDNGTAVRGKTEVCVQLGWPVPDRCSRDALPTFNY